MAERTLHDPDNVLTSVRRELARLPQILNGLLDGMDAVTARGRPTVAEWSPVEIVCHLRDEEVEDFGLRLQAVVDGHSELPPIDPERWAVERRYRDVALATALRDLLARRDASLRVLATMAPERLSRSASRPKGGRLSGLDLLVAWVAHDRLHLQQLAATLATIWANQWSPLKADYAGPIPHLQRADSKQNP